jgi:hypothetical protein
VFCFTRDRFLVALNFTSDPVALALAEDLGRSARVELSTDVARELEEVELDTLVLGPDEGLILRLG